MLAGGAVQAQESLRPEVGKPLQAAQELIKAGRYQEALAKVREAEAAGARNANETYLIERMRIAAASGAGDVDTAARSFEALSGSGRVSGPDKLRMIESIAGGYYRVAAVREGDAVGPALLRAKAARAGAIRTMLIQSQYLSGDFAGAAKELMAEIQGRRARRQPAAGRPTEAAAQRGVEAGRQQRLCVRDRKAGHLLPEEGVLGRPAEPHAAQAQSSPTGSRSTPIACRSPPAA